MGGDKRFEVVKTEGGAFSSYIFCILRDRETGAQYLFVESGHGAGLTPLLDKDGKPTIS